MFISNKYAITDTSWLNIFILHKAVLTDTFVNKYALKLKPYLIGDESYCLNVLDI
jgi:hypothetical protein